jgi:hypothetical protein
MMLDPQLELAMTLKAEQWNVVMAGLQEMPYRVVAPIIDALARQFREATAAADQTGPLARMAEARTGEHADGTD